MGCYVCMIIALLLSSIFTVTSSITLNQLAQAQLIAGQQVKNSGTIPVELAASTIRIWNNLYMVMHAW
jgi:hypothetical protein